MKGTVVCFLCPSILPYWHLNQWTNFYRSGEVSRRVANHGAILMYLWGYQYTIKWRDIRKAILSRVVWSYFRRRFGLDIGFIYHLYTRLGTTNDYSATINLHKWQITTQHSKPFTDSCAFTSRSLVMSSNKGVFSASALKPSLSGGSLPTELFLSLSLSVMSRPTFGRPIYLGIKHPSGAYDDILLTVRQLRACWYGALSLTRGRVRHLQFLLALASAVIFGSESVETCDHILLSQIWDFLFVAS
jgi:hypothetical protein